MNDEERDKTSKKVRAWLQGATDKVGTDPYLTAEILGAADRRAEDILAVGLAENARMVSRIQDIRTNPILSLISLVKTDVVRNRLWVVEEQSRMAVLTGIGVILAEEISNISTDRRQGYKFFVRRCFLDGDDIE